MEKKIIIEKIHQIYRFKLSEEVMNAITTFAKTHQYDERILYKESWNIWFQENKNMMEDEINRMTRLGYKGDIKDKMFKAGRYYFRKKNITKKDNTKDDKRHDATNDAKDEEDEEDAEDAEDLKKRNYISTDGELLKDMDEHIKKSLLNKNFTPAIGYSDFCENNIDILQREIRRMFIENKMSPPDIVIKIKKTYKNRYFILTKKFKHLLPLPVPLPVH
jgi:hypothetical protein